MLKGEDGAPALRVHKAGEKPDAADDDEDDDEVDPDEPGEASGRSRGGARAALVDPARKWQQMFYEGGRPRCAMHPTVSARARRAVPRAYEACCRSASTHAELLDVMNEMLGKLPGVPLPVDPPELDSADGGVDGQQGNLCAAFEWDGAVGAWRIASMLVGVVG